MGPQSQKVVASRSNQTKYDHDEDDRNSILVVSEADVSEHQGRAEGTWPHAINVGARSGLTG